MSDDAPTMNIWQYHPVTSDSGDVLLTANDIKSNVAPYVYYNTPGATFSQTLCLIGY